MVNTYRKPILMLLIIYLVIIALTRPSEAFRLQKTREHLSCLYLYNSDVERSLTSIVPYCLGSKDLPVINHCYGEKLTLDALKSNNVTVTDLYDQNVPIDTINDYEMFLQNRLLGDNQAYCKCSGRKWFGVNCEYTFVGNQISNLFGDILKIRFSSRESRSYDDLILSSNTTCYEGLKCKSVLCLDWRDICNGDWNCPNGEDEVNCIKIDTYACPNTKFRCRNGMCIDRKFLFDGYRDCADGSDEQKKIFKVGRKVRERFLLEYEEEICPWGELSCGDGTCKHSLFSCRNSRRDVYLFDLFDNPHRKESNETLCWQIMICSMASVYPRFVHSASLKCSEQCQSYDNDCFTLRQKLCPKYYYFPSKSKTQHFSTNFLYDTTKINYQFRDMILPNFVCFDNDTCLLSSCQNLTLINGQKCDSFTNHWTDIRVIGWHGESSKSKMSSYFSFLKTFHRRHGEFISLECSEKLYKCRWTNRCISHFWRNDGEKDCPGSDDEDSVSLCKRNSSDHFDCKASSPLLTSCIHRKQLMDSTSDCGDPDIDELYPLTCTTGNSLGCKYLRNDISVIPNDYFIFQELCNGVYRFTDYRKGNETDESNCDEWQNTCANRAEPCFQEKAWKSCIGSVWRCRMYVKLRYKPFTFEGFNQQPPPGLASRGLLDNLLFGKSTRKPEPVGNRTSKPILIRPATSRPSYSIETNLSDYVLNYCNRGILLTTRDGTDRCLCPSSYYGSSCQYQSHRVLMIISVDATNLLRNRWLVLRIVTALLSIENDEAFSAEQITHIVPTHTSVWRHLVPLRRRNKLNSSLCYVRIDVFVISSENVQLQSSWRYEIPFQDILPVSRIRAHLPIDQIRQNMTCSSCSNGKCIVYANNVSMFHCLCNVGWYGKHCELESLENDAVCASKAQILYKNVCVCPLFTFGDKCYIKSDVKELSCTNGGTLLSESSPPLCLCPEGFHGPTCELKDANVVINLPENRLIKKTIPIVAIHFLDLDSNISITTVKDRLIFINVSLPTTFSKIFLHNQPYLPPFIFMQFYFDLSNTAGDLYLVALLKRPINTLYARTLSDYHCRHVNTYLNSTIMNEYSILRRYKFYFKICLMKSPKCFVDEKYLCLCDNFGRFECLRFNHHAGNCTRKSYCQNGAHCVEPTRMNDSIKFGCLCGSCEFGGLCQFTTAHYSISLDALIEISGTIGETTVARIIFCVVVLLFTVGLICNLFSFIFLCRSSFQQVGCEFYILSLTVVGQLGLIVFVLKFILLMKPSTDFNHNLWSCRILESAISFLPVLFDWLTACIAIERAVMIVQGLSFNRKRSKFMARYIVLPLIVLTTFATTVHRSLYRRVINDFRSNKPIWWCILEINRHDLQLYDITINIVHLILPLLFNLLSVLFILFSRIRRTRSILISHTGKMPSYSTVLRKQLQVHLSIIISPAILGLFQTPRLILSFAFVCIQAPWKIHFYVISYIASCMPLMAGTLLFFIIPSPTYRKAIKTFLSKLRPTSARQ